MRATIVPCDQKICRDEIVVELPDWPFDDSNIHAIQWYGTEGEIEYTGQPKPPNQTITDLASLQPYLDALEAHLELPQPITEQTASVPSVELTPAEKLARSGLTVAELKELLGLD